MSYFFILVLKEFTMFIPTFIISKLGHEAIDQHNANVMLHAGGACCLMLNKETRDANIEAARTTGHAEVIAAMEATPENKPYVVIWDKLADYLGPEYTQAILEHEFAHAELQHTEKRLVSQRLGLDEDLEEELQADALAASRVTPKVMGKALIKMTEFLVDEMLAKQPKRVHERENLIAATIMTTSLKSRLEVLHSLHQASR